MLDKSKTILVTGGTGFIGSRLIDFLVNDGFQNIYCLTRSPSIESSYDHPVKAVTADLMNQTEIDDMILDIRPHIVFHLAADARPSRDIDDLGAMMRSNVDGMLHLLTSIVKCNIKIESFIHTGSCEEYGLNAQPFVESMTASPVSIYSGTKAASTALAMMFYNVFAIPISVVRPSLVYGPGQSNRFFIPQMLEKLLADEPFPMTLGEQTRDFIYIDDLIECLVRISGTPELHGKIVNASYGQSVSLKEIVRLAVEAAQSKSDIQLGALPYRNNEIMSYEVSNRKAVENTGWEPKVSIAEGLSRIVSHMRGVSE